MNSLLKYLIPRFPLRDLPSMIGCAMLGGLLAGIYGVIHDQVTFSISPEYFTKLKFKQFDYLPANQPDRMIAGEIGFLASWWVGLIIAWFLARKHFAHQRRNIAWKKIFQSFGVVAICGIVAATGGFLLGWSFGPDADYSHWSTFFRKYNIDDHWSFVRVAYIHNASYLGGLTGLILALCMIRNSKLTASKTDDESRP